jgi:hypothetical protein
VTNNTNVEGEMEASARKNNNPVAIDVSGVQTWKVVRGGEVDDCRAAREQDFGGTPLSRMWHHKTMVNDGTVISSKRRVAASMMDSTGRICIHLRESTQEDRRDMKFNATVRMKNSSALAGDSR